MSTVADHVRLLLVVIPFIAAPGPGNIMCAAVGARYGLSRTLPFIAGLELMVFLPALAVGFGVGELLERAGSALAWLQVAGSIFILYLAVRLLRDPPRPDDDTGLDPVLAAELSPTIRAEAGAGAAPDHEVDAGAGDGAGRGPPSFLDAVVLQALNAKGAVVLLVIFAEFAGGTDTVGVALRIATVITAVSLIFHVLWLYLGRWLALRFSTPRALRVQGWLYATMLATVAVWLLVA